MKQNFTRWARKCDFTGEGMNEGYVVHNGELYIKRDEDAKKWALDHGYKTMQEAYNDDVIYYTSWEDTDDWEYIEVDGKLWEVEEFDLVRIRLRELGELIQDDIITYMEGMDQKLVSDICQFVVNRFNNFIP